MVKILTYVFSGTLNPTHFTSLVKILSRYSNKIESV